MMTSELREQLLGDEDELEGRLLQATHLPGSCAPLSVLKPGTGSHPHSGADELSCCDLEQEIQCEHF